VKDPVSRVNTLLLNPSEVHLPKSSPASGLGRADVGKFVLPPEKKVSQYKPRKSRLDNELKEESKSSYQDMLTKGYRKKSSQGGDLYEIRLEESSQKNLFTKAGATRNLQRNTADERPTKYADLIERFVQNGATNSKKELLRDSTKTSSKTRSQVFDAQSSKAQSLKQLPQRVMSSPSKIRPKQLEKVIKNSYKPLDPQSHLHRVVSGSREKSKSYYLKMKEEKRRASVKKGRAGSKIGRIEIGEIPPFGPLDHASQIIVEDQTAMSYNRRRDQGRKTAQYWNRRLNLASSEHQSKRLASHSRRLTPSHQTSPYKDPQVISDPEPSQHDPMTAHHTDAALSLAQTNSHFYANLLNSQHLSPQEASQLS
jgi:hypothetical protein